MLHRRGRRALRDRSRGTSRANLAFITEPPRLHRHTYADYVAVEQTSSTKHEFFDGEIYAMAGGTEKHSALAMEILWQLRNAIGERPCRVHTSDLRIYVEAAGLATFPDGSVICGPLQQHAPSPTSRRSSGNSWIATGARAPLPRGIVNRASGATSNLADPVSAYAASRAL